MRVSESYSHRTHSGHCLVSYDRGKSGHRVNEWLTHLKGDLRDKVGVAQNWSTQRLRRSPIHAITLVYKYIQKGNTFA